MTTPAFVRAYPSAGTLGNGPGNLSVSVNIDTTGLGANGAIVVFICGGASGANMTGKSFTTPTLGGSSTGWSETIAETLNAASVSGMMGAWVLLNPTSSASIALALAWSTTAGAADEIMAVVGLYSDVSSVSAFTVDNDGGSSTSDTMTNAAGAGNLTVASWAHGSNISSVTSGTLRGAINNYSTNFSNGCMVFIEGDTAAFSSGSSDSNIGMQIKLLGTAASATGSPTPTPLPRGIAPDWQWTQRVGNDPVSTATNASADVGSFTFVASGPTASVAPNAGAASFSFVANAPTPSVAPNAGAASFSFTANAPTSSVAPKPGVASFSFTAGAPSTSVTFTAGAASVTFTASAPSTSVSVKPTAATFTFTAPDPTVSTSGNTNAPGGLASFTFTSNAPTASVAPTAAAATFTFTASSPSTSVSVTPTSASFTFTALAPAGSIAAKPSSATFTFTANNAAATVAAAAGLATVAFTGRSPSVSVKPNATVASFSFIAYQPTVTASTSAAIVPGRVIAGRDPRAIYGEDPSTIHGRDPRPMYGQDPSAIAGRDPRGMG